MIDKQKISEPHLWRLVIELSHESLSAMAFCPDIEHSLQTLFLELPHNAHNTPGALEEVVYNNPALTDDFGHVTVLWRSDRFAVMPGFVNPTLAAEVLRKQFPEEKWQGATEILTDISEFSDMAIAYEVPERMLAFVRRTFNNPPIRHPLSVQALWFAAKNSGRPAGKTFANVTDKSIDIIVSGRETPLMVNSFQITDPADAVYYLLAARRAFDLAESDEIILAGPPSIRAAVSALLRRYVGYVMPAIIPEQMLKMGQGITAIPFEMTIAEQ